MRVVFPVRVAVVLPVRGDPPRDGTFDCHAAQDAKRPYQDWGGFERAMGEQPVETDGNAESRKQVKKQKKGQVDGTKPTAPQSEHGEQDTNRREDDHEQMQEPPCPTVLINEAQVVSVG
jgi:hypothetical protein